MQGGALNAVVEAKKGVHGDVSPVRIHHLTYTRIARVTQRVSEKRMYDEIMKRGQFAQSKDKDKENIMDPINILVWIIIGAVAGWLASIVMKTNAQQGLLADIVVGIIGGFLGGWLLDLLGVGGAVTGLNLGSLLTAFIGAVVLLAILRLLRR